LDEIDWEYESIERQAQLDIEAVDLMGPFTHQDGYDNYPSSFSGPNTLITDQPTPDQFTICT